jgi:hypothetical protein
VRRSVANNLNDIAKDHPNLVLKIARQWSGQNENTDKIIKHGCRTLLKNGHTHALKLHGFNPNKKAEVRKLALSKKKVKVGDDLNFNFQFVNNEKRVASFRLEYVIDYITSSGKISRKIFQITENKFQPDAFITISRKQSFKNLTTRKHYKGKHNISILANGKSLASSSFLVY